MSVQVVFWAVLITTTRIAISSVHAVTIDSEEVCYIKIRNTQVRLIPYHEEYQERCWIFFSCIAFRTRYIRQTYTQFSLKNVSCNYETLQQSNNHEPLRTCDCDKPQNECDSICEHKDLYDNFEVHKLLHYCPEGYRLDILRGFCEPVCNTNCLNGWCQKPKVCACESNYGSNGDECVQVKRKVCLHGDKDHGHCKCYVGWRGDSCETPSHCLVAEFLGSNKPREFWAYSTGKRTKPLREITSDRDLENSRMLPACSQECPDQLYREGAVYFNNSDFSVIFHVVPKDVQCRPIENDGNNFTNKLSNILLGILFGITSVTVFCILVIFVRKTRKMKCIPHHHNTSPVYDDIE